MSPLVQTLVELTGLKEVTRAGWVRAGVGAPESVAAHSWGTALLALVLAPAHLDRARLLTYAILHDLAEVRVGDITPHDGVSKAQKKAMEAEAMGALAQHLPAHILQAWHAYEAQDNAEARFIRQLDRLDMALQAVRYEDTQGVDTAEFIQSASDQIHVPELVALISALQTRQ